MKYKDFGDINEEKILEKYPEVIKNIKNEFNTLQKPVVEGYPQAEVTESSAESKGYARVLTMDNNHINSNYTPKEEPIINSTPINMGGYQIDSNIKTNNGASYVVVVAAIIALIALVYIVTTYILNMLNGVI